MGAQHGMLAGMATYPTQQEINQFVSGGIPACSQLGQQLMRLASALDAAFTANNDAVTGAAAFDLIRGQVSIPEYVCQVHGFEGCAYL